MNYPQLKQGASRFNDPSCANAGNGVEISDHSLLDPSYSDYLDLYKEKFPRYYKKFAKQPEMTLITAKPTLLVKLVIIKGDFYRDPLDLANNNAYRLKIDD